MTKSFKIFMVFYGGMKCICAVASRQDMHGLEERNIFTFDIIILAKLITVFIDHGILMSRR